MFRGRQITISARGVVDEAVTIEPGLHADEVGHVGRDVALEDGTVAPDDVFVVHLSFVGLVYHWGNVHDSYSHWPSPGAGGGLPHTPSNCYNA